MTDSHRQLVVLWHVHQPFFVSDEEVHEHIARSYQPLIEMHRELGIPYGLNVCGGLLERLKKLAPDWLELLRSEIESRRIELLGSGKFHPLLPLLPYDRARAQVEADIDAKRSVLCVRPKGFWPTDLGWTHWLVPILCGAGVSWVAVDSSAKVAASILPGWTTDTTMGHRVMRPDLSPLVAERELGEVHRLRLGQYEIFALLRHHELTWELVDQQEGVLHSPAHLGRALDRIEEYYRAGSSLLVIGDDGERIHPQTITNYRRWLTSLQDLGIQFLTGSDALASRAAAATDVYLPTSTFMVDFSAWLTTPDDYVCFRHLDEVERQFERVAGHVIRHGDEEARTQLTALNAMLLSVEDSGFYFWKYLRRTREPFLAVIADVRAGLDALEAQLSL